VTAAGASQRPEEFTLVMLIAVEGVSVGEDDLCAEQLVAGEAVGAPEDS